MTDLADSVAETVDRVSDVADRYRHGHDRLLGTYNGVSAAAELDEEVVAKGVGHAMGELLTCPFCLAQWVATGFVAGMVFAPRATRLLAATFAGVAVSDFLQYAYAAAQQVEKSRPAR